MSSNFSDGFEQTRRPALPCGQGRRRRHPGEPLDRKASACAVRRSLLCLLTAAALLAPAGCNQGGKPTQAEPKQGESTGRTEPQQPEPRGSLLPDPRHRVPASGEIRQAALIYSVGSRRMLGHFVYHEAPGNAPILLLLHDQYGIDGWLRQRADAYARLGYHVLCPDLSELLNEVLDQPLLDNVIAAVAEAETRLGRVSTGRLAAIGWGKGGSQALALARHFDLEALIICYGPLIATPAALEKVREPVLGIFGRLDTVVTEESVQEFQRVMQKMGGTFAGNIWSDEGHDFMRRPNDPTNVLEADLEIIRWLDTYVEP